MFPKVYIRKKRKKKKKKKKKRKKRKREEQKRGEPDIDNGDFFPPPM
jgi:hypothetical protein